MDDKNYYLEYLKKTTRFPLSIYHSAKHDAVREVFSGIPAGSRVLDAGCGIGNVTGGCCGQYKIFGLDEQASAIQYCREHWKGTYVESSLYKIPFGDDFFDMVVFLDTIEHLREPVLALKELVRVLKPGAPVLICTMNYGNPLWTIAQYTWHPLFGGNCKPYSKDVHPTPYTAKRLREHCAGLFKEAHLVKRMLRMELFYLGKKPW